MEQFYKVSDGSLMSKDDFISYVLYLMQTEALFQFEEWFGEDDFSNVETYNYLRKIFKNDKGTDKFYKQS